MTKQLSQWIRQKDNYQKVSLIKPWVEGDLSTKPAVWKTNQKVLLDFVKRLCRELRGCTFTRRNDESYWIHRDDNPYVMGWVGRSLNFLSTVTSDDYLIAITARTISNWKYSDSSWQHYTKMSTNEKTAMKNARTYLRTMTPHDMAYVHDQDIRNALTRTTDSEQRRLGKCYSSLFSSVQEDYTYLSDFKKGKKDNTVLGYVRKIYHEYKHLIEDDPDFIRLCEEFFAQEKVFAKALKVQHKVYHIHVYENAFKDREFGITFIGNTEGGKLPDSNAVGNMGLSPKHTFTDKTLPELLMGKISVLTMLDNGGYVDEVGYKIDTTMFYVITERDFHITSDTTR